MWHWRMIGQMWLLKFSFGIKGIYIYIYIYIYSKQLFKSVIVFHCITLFAIIHKCNLVEHKRPPQTFYIYFIYQLFIIGLNWLFSIFPSTGLDITCSLLASGYRSQWSLHLFLHDWHHHRPSHHMPSCQRPCATSTWQANNAWTGYLSAQAAWRLTVCAETLSSCCISSLSFVSSFICVPHSPLLIPCSSISVSLTSWL